MVAKQIFLAALSLLSRTSAAAGSFDVTVEQVAWDDTTYTLTSSRPYPGADQAWLPQSNGWVIKPKPEHAPCPVARSTNPATIMQVHRTGAGQPWTVLRG